VVSFSEISPQNSCMLLSHMCYMSRPSHSSWFDHQNNIWWWVQIITFPFMQPSPLRCYVVPLRPKYLIVLHYLISISWLGRQT
jgi:hypothetical protein